jgi:flagellar export protein FliJ
MARFVYRLQKVYALRERKVKQQEQRVVEAQNRVNAIIADIEAKKNEVRLLAENMAQSHHTLLAAHDAFIHDLHQVIDRRYQDLAMAKQELALEKQRLVEYQAELEALVKHRDKQKEAWQAEQNMLEMKQLDEVGSQRYFRAQAELKAEDPTLD